MKRKNNFGDYYNNKFKFSKINNEINQINKELYINNYLQKLEKKYDKIFKYRISTLEKNYNEFINSKKENINMMEEDINVNKYYIKRYSPSVFNFYS